MQEMIFGRACAQAGIDPFAKICRHRAYEPHQLQIVDPAATQLKLQTFAAELLLRSSDPSS